MLVIRFGIGESLIELATQVAVDCLPGLLEVAKEVPFAAPAAGMLLQFYDRYKAMEENKAAFEELRIQMKLTSEWIALKGLHALQRDCKEGDPLHTVLMELTKAVRGGTKVAIDQLDLVAIVFGIVGYERKSGSISTTNADIPTSMS